MQLTSCATTVAALFIFTDFVYQADVHRQNAARCIFHIVSNERREATVFFSVIGGRFSVCFTFLNSTTSPHLLFPW